MVQGFCPLVIKIIQFAGGFRHNLFWRFCKACVSAFRDKNKAFFTCYQTNFRPARKRGRTLCSQGTFQCFCSVDTELFNQVEFARGSNICSLAERYLSKSKMASSSEHASCNHAFALQTFRRFWCLDYSGLIFDQTGQKISTWPNAQLLKSLAS